MIINLVFIRHRVELSGHQPETCSDVAHDDEDEEEEDQPLYSSTDSENEVDVAHQCLLVLYYPD